jgi:hypothetical protein
MEGDEPLVKAFNGQWFILPSAGLEDRPVFPFSFSFQRREREEKEIL